MNVRKLHFPFQVPELSLKKFKGSTQKPTSSIQSGHHINPRYRAYGKARIDMALHIQNQQDWDSYWKAPKNTFAISFPREGSWKQCIEYQVDDFAAEIGFWVDIVGIPVNAFGPDYAQFSGPRGEFTFAVSSTPEGLKSTLPETIRIQFMVENIVGIVNELTGRSVVFDQQPYPVSPGSSTYIATFLTPHGIAVDLWEEGDDSKLPDPGNLNHEKPKLEAIPSQMNETTSGDLAFTQPQDKNTLPNLPYPNSANETEVDLGIRWKIFEDSSSYQTFKEYDLDKDEQIDHQKIPANSLTINQPVKNISDRLPNPDSLPIIPKAKLEEFQEETFVEKITYEPVDEIIPDLISFPQQPETKHKPL